MSVSDPADYPDARDAYDPAEIHHLEVRSIKTGDPMPESIDWREFPRFAVVTGPNGSGKTLLLQALSTAASETARAVNEKVTSLRKQVVRWIREGNDSYASTLKSRIRKAKRNPTERPAGDTWLDGQLWALSDKRAVTIEKGSFQSLESYDVTIGRAGSRAARILLGLGIREADPSPLPDLDIGDPRVLRFEHIPDGLALAFLGHLQKQAGTAMPQDELYGADLGTPPWEILNQTLAAAGFGYTVVPPDSNALSAPYRVTFRAPDGSGPIRFEELSSGERSVVGLVASLYSGTQGGPLPELFLLDEPDAHLHPSLTQTFISTLYEQIAQKLGVRVVITTHSPSTVALAPEGSVYEVRREGRKMFADRVENKWDVVGKLTSGFVTVAPGTRNVLVEDDDDAQFHDGVLEALLNHGLSPVPAGRLAFIPASIETGNGGCTEVAKVVRAANTGPLQDFSTVWGLVDLDAGDEEPENKQELLDHDRIVKLGRYSIENYWVDPVMVAVVSLRKDDSQPLPGMEPFVGKQAEIQNATSEDLQHIADHVLGAMRDALNTPPTEDEEQREPVPYVTGQKIQLPKWLLHRKGKTLKGPATSLPYFDCVIRRIVSAYNVVPLIPQELADTYARLAGVDPQPSA